MGHNLDSSKYNVQNNKLKQVLIKLLETTNAIMEFNLTLMSAEKDIEITQKIIDDNKIAVSTIKKVKHNEILVDIYNSFVSNNLAYFVAASRTMSLNDKIAKWDTEEGFADFLKAQEEAFKECDKEWEKRKKEQEMVRKAKEEGKQVEFLYKDGKVKQVIVEEKLN